MAKFLIASDLQLGVGAELGREPGERLAEQEAVWLKIVQTANDLDVPLVFLGDAWERRRPTPAELIAFFRPLDLAKLEPLLLPGNHDVEAFDRPTGYDVRGPEVASSRVRFHVPRPDVVFVNGVAFCCLPWAPPSRLVALEAGGDRDDLNDRLAAGLVEIARGLYARAKEIKPDAAVVLAGHWHVDSATTTTGAGAPRGLFREPLLDYAALEAIGFDAIILGHHHTPAMYGDRGFSVGSPMPCSFGEADYQHVVWLLDVEPGRMQAFQIPIESRRLVTLNVDGPKTVGLDDVDGAIVKVKIRASEEEARRLDLAGYRQQLLDAGAHKVWSMVVEVEKPDVVRGATLDEDVSDVDALTRWIELNWDGLGLDTDSAGDLLDLGAGYLERAGAVA